MLERQGSVIDSLRQACDEKASLENSLLSVAAEKEMLEERLLADKRRLKEKLLKERETFEGKLLKSQSEYERYLRGVHRELRSVEQQTDTLPLAQVRLSILFVIVKSLNPSLRQSTRKPSVGCVRRTLLCVKPCTIQNIVRIATTPLRSRPSNRSSLRPRTPCVRGETRTSR